MRRTLAILLTALTVPAVAAAELSESAKLKFSGLGELRIGMTEKEVEAVLGSNVKQDKLAGTGSCGTATLAKRDYLLFTNDVLRRITLNGPDYAVKSSGLRVGDPQSAIRDAYADGVRRTKHVYDPNGFYFSLAVGRKALRFETDGKKIDAIHAGRTPEVDYVEGCA